MVHRLSINGYPTPDRMEPVGRALEDWQGAMYPPLPLPNPCKHSTPTHLGSQTLSAESSGAESWRSFTALQRSRLDGDPGPHLLRGPSPQIQSHPPGTPSHPACLWARRAAAAATLVTGQLQAGLPQKQAESRTKTPPWGQDRDLQPEESLGKPQAPLPPRRGPGAPHPTTLLATSCPHTVTPAFKGETNTLQPA